MVKRSLKKKRTQTGRGYVQALRDYVIEKSMLIDTEFNSPPLTIFTPLCNLFVDNNCFNFNDLHIENTLEEIVAEYLQNGYLYLRPYRGEKTFIIGCGNNRLDCSNLLNRNSDNCDLSHSNIYHNHRDAYTLDITLVANPSIVANFNKDLRLSKIPDNSFNFIIFEGGGDPRDNPIEIRRLLNRYTTSMCISVSPEIGYHIYSVWSNGEYNIYE